MATIPRLPIRWAGMVHRTRAAVRERCRLVVRLAYAGALRASPRLLVRRPSTRPAPAPAVLASTCPGLLAPDQYDDSTRQWVHHVLEGSFRAPFPLADPEGLHDTLRLRGVLPALAEVYVRTGSADVYDRMGELLQATASLTDRHAAVAWDTSTTALRLLSIFGAAEVLRRTATTLPFSDDWLPGFLRAHAPALAIGAASEPEGNHRFVNSAARAALYLLLHPGRELPPGLVHMLGKSLRSQFLPDGGHVERAPHYHVQVLALAVMLLQADRARSGRLAAELASVLARARAGLSALTTPGGAPVRLGDAGRTFSGRRPAADVRFVVEGTSGPSELAAVAVLPDFGVGRWRWTCESSPVCLFVDFGPLGLDGNPGHGHADALSFSFFVDGQEVVADSGTYLYADTADAMWFKMAQAHSTVGWPGTATAELSRYFRWRRVAPAPARRGPTAGSHANLLLSASQSWSRESRPQQLTRSWLRLPRGLAIVDEIRADEAVQAIGRIRLHPDAVPSRLGPNETIVSFPGGRLRVRTTGSDAGAHSFGGGWYAPEYGSRRPAQAIVCAFPAAQPRSVCCTFIELLAP